MDVPNEINDDEFWAEFRHVVKSANRDACLIGEIWAADPRWVNDTHFDGLMHYPIRDALISILLGKIRVSDFAASVESFFNIYPRENIFSMYVSMGTHDTERIFTVLGGNLEKIKLAFLFIFSFPGAPAIYYGDEIGLEGGKDPDSRRAFPWNSEDWKADLQPWVQNLISVRKERASMRRGDFSRILLDEKNRIYAFIRTLGKEISLVILNISDNLVRIEIPVNTFWNDGRTIKSLLDNRPYNVANGLISLDLPAWKGIILG